MTEHLFFVECEVRYADSKSGEALIAFVNTYTYAVQKARAVGKARSALREDGYEMLAVSDAYRVDEDSFTDVEDEEHGEPTRSDLASIEASGDVYYAYFHAYPEAADHEDTEPQRPRAEINPK